MKNLLPTLMIAMAGAAMTLPAAAEIHGDRYDRARPSDVVIEDRVHDELEMSLGAKADRIDVEVVNGVVVLDGWVPSETDRRIAHDAVYSVSGVRGLRIASLNARSYYQ